RFGNLQLRRPCRDCRGRSRDRGHRDHRLRHRRGRRQAHQSDGGGRPDLRRLCAGRRHGSLRGDELRLLGPAAGVDLRRLSLARPDRDPRAAAHPHGDAFALHGIRRERPRRRRRHRASGGDRQRRQRCLAAAGSGNPPFADDAAPRARGDRGGGQSRYSAGGLRGSARVKPVNFDYARPKDVETSLSLIAKDGLSVKVVAGSQSLGPMLAMRLVQPDLLVDITSIEELRQVKEEADGAVIGACVTHADIEDGRAPDVTRGALPSVAHSIAYRAVRNRGTIGGSLSHADPSADWIAILAALGATVTLRGPNGARTLPVEAYMLGALEP